MSEIVDALHQRSQADAPVNSDTLSRVDRLTIYSREAPPPVARNQRGPCLQHLPRPQPASYTSSTITLPEGNRFAILIGRSILRTLGRRASPHKVLPARHDQVWARAYLIEGKRCPLDRWRSCTCVFAVHLVYGVHIAESSTRNRMTHLHETIVVI